MSRLLFAACVLAGPTALIAQNRTTQLITVARGQIAAHDLDSAETTLEAAFAQAAYRMDSVWVYIWYGVVEHLRGRDDITRASFRRALLLHPNPGADSLASISPALAELFDQESRAIRVRSSNDVDQPARWRSGPVFVYPPSLRARRIAGHALVRAIVDTAGLVVQRSIEVLDTPDPAFVEPLRRMMLDATFHPARVRGRAVRSWVSYEFNLTPPSPRNPVRLVDAAREQLRRTNPDSALTLVDQAIDPENGATPAVRVYALLVRGIAWRAKHSDSLAAISFDTALGSYRELTAGGVDLAPFLRKLADSVSRSRLTPQRE